MSMLFGLDPELVAETTDDWYTPHWIFQAAAVEFDMDVAAPIRPRFRTVTAKRYLTVVDDGLTTPWEGVVWCNPPYSRAEPWVLKWAEHSDGMLLLPAVKATWLGNLLAGADALTILRVDFLRPSGAKAELLWPSLLASRGAVSTAALARVAASDKCARGAYMTRPDAAA